MNRVGPNELRHAPFAIFVCSTTGQGEPPDNMKLLYRFLLRLDLPSNSLQTMRFGVFGLGDSNYPLFNAVARRLDVRLKTLGADVLVERGLGDEQAPRGYEEALHPWMIQLWAAIECICPRAPDELLSVAYANAPLPSLKYHVDVLPAGGLEEAAAKQQRKVARDKAAQSCGLDGSNGVLVRTSTHWLPLRLIDSTRMTPDSHLQDVRLLDLEIPSLQQQEHRGWPRLDSQSAEKHPGTKRLQQQ
jgi:sulfite reductase alpha subunit-like flavoprotein